MKIILRSLALVVLIGAIVWWVAAGANRRWNRNKVEIRTVDEVTGIEGVTYQKKFIPGVEFLAGSAGVSVVLVGVSFLFRTKRNPQTSNERTN